MDRPSVEQQIAALRSEFAAALRSTVDAARREILAELRTIREALPRRAPGNDAKLAALLEHLRAGLELTSTRLHKASADKKNEAFREAVIAIAGENEKTAVDRLGKFLAKHVGIVAGGKCLEKVGRARDGNLYRVVQVLESNTWATLGRPAYGVGERKTKP